MDEYKHKCTRMSNHLFIQELDEAAAILDDELKAISEVEKTNTSVFVVEDFFEDNDDDDLTGELANLDSLSALQQELNMSALSFEEFNANNSKASAYAMEQEGEEEYAVITDIGEILIGDAIMEEEPCTTWKPTVSSSQDSSIHSATQRPDPFDKHHNHKQQQPHTQTVHRVVSRGNGGDDFATKQSSNDSEDSSVFDASPKYTPGSMHLQLMRQDRLDITLSPIRFNDEADENKDVPNLKRQTTPMLSIKAGFRNIPVDKTPSVNAMDTRKSEDATPKIQNTRTGSNMFQFQESDTSDFCNENNGGPPVSEELIGAPTRTTHPLPMEEPSPMSSLLNALLASPESMSMLGISNANGTPTVLEEEQESSVGVSVASESSNSRESHSFTSLHSQPLASSTSTTSEAPSVSSASSVSTGSAVSTASLSSAQSNDKKKWNPIRLFNQRKSFEHKTRKSKFSKPKSSSKNKTRHRLQSFVNLPTVSEDKTLAPAQEALPPNNTVAQAHDPNENEIRQTLGMQEGSTPPGGRRNSLFQDNKERVAVNRMMKMLMEQRNKNKTQEKRERKLLHMLCDARNDRKQLIDEQEKEVHVLHRKLKSSLENNEILRQENELLLMQTDAWKEISRQSNQTAALYKYTFNERQGQPWYEAPTGERIDDRSMKMEEAEDELAQVKRDKEELEAKLKQLQKESHLGMEGLKYQAQLVAEELEQSRSLFEDKLEKYIQGIIELKEERDTLRNELEQSHAAAVSARQEFQGHQTKLESNRPKMHSDIMNLRIHRLEDQIVNMQDFHRSRLVQSKTMVEARIKSLEASLCDTSTKLQAADGDLKTMRDQLARERKSRSQSTRIFQQQNYFLVSENESLKREVQSLQTELASTRSDEVLIEAALVKERKEVERLQQQVADEAEVVTELQEELDSLQTKLEKAKSETSFKSAAKSAEVALGEAQDTLEHEIQAAENVALRVQVERLKHELKSKSPSPLTPRSSSYPSTYKSPVERRVRDQVLRLRNSLTPKHAEEEELDSVAPPSSPFFTDSPSVTLSGQPLSSISSPGSTSRLNSPSPKKFASMLRPKCKGPPMPPRTLDKENNNTVMSPTPGRRGGGLGGLSTRTGLGIR